MFEQDSPDLMLLLRMLSLGQGAWDMIDSQVFKEPRLVCALLKIKSVQRINIGWLRVFCVGAVRIKRW